MTNAELRATLKRMKSEENYNPQDWPKWLIDKLQEWFADRGENE